MKKITFILFFVALIGITVFAQVPDKINYQAVIRNSSGELVTDQDVGIKVSILDETSSGTLLYSEEHAVPTNAYGQVAIEIGGGTPDFGDFSTIDWGLNDKFLKLEVDIEGGTSYVPIGTSQMLSVPYALYANSASNLGNENIYSPVTDTLFVVKDHDGNVVFAVFPDGAQVIVNQETKGKVGGFAVSGRTSTKGVEEYLIVTADSTIIYVNDTLQTKGKVGGFAVSGRTSTKGLADYFNVSGDTTIIIDPSEPRVVWFPKKEAFWAGRVLIEHTDSVGFNSMAIGYEAVAKGNKSQSFGYQTRARGDFSTAIGYKTQANGNFCFAVGGEAHGVDGTATGNYTIADGVASFALGLGANAIGIANTAIGLGSSATGDFAATAFGVAAEATARRSTAIGYGSVASAEQSMAIGVTDTASAYNSLAMGFGSKASGIASMALGSFVEANSPGSFVVGQLNEIFAINDLWSPEDPLFVIGNGFFEDPEDPLSTAHRQNALTILKNGNMGVGVDVPHCTLHIKDVMKLEPTTITDILLVDPLYVPEEGDMYYDLASHTLQIFGGFPAEWKTVTWTTTP